MLSPASQTETQTIMMVLTEKMENTAIGKHTYTYIQKTNGVTVLKYKRERPFYKKKYCSLVHRIKLYNKKKKKTKRFVLPMNKQCSTDQFCSLLITIHLCIRY